MMTILKRVATALAALTLIGAGAAVGMTPASAGAPVYAASALPPFPTITDAMRHAAPTKGFNSPKGAPDGASGVHTALTTCTGACYSYGVGIQTVNNTGVIANTRVSNPYLATNDYHSLMELAVIAHTGAGGTRQIVEIGITVDRTGVNGTDYTHPHLFVFSWKNGVGCGYNGGCGYTDVSTVALNAGDAVTSDVGTVKQVIIWHDPSQHVWWLGYGGSWIGYYPDSNWTSPAFTQGDEYQGFGEVASQYQESCSDMGSGDQGNPYTIGSTQAYFGSVSYYDTSGTQQLSTIGIATVPGSSSAEYSVGITSSNRTYAIGGPGFNSAGTAVGTKGSC